MADCVAIIPDFSFIEQIQELSLHFSRSLPESSRQGYIASLQSLTKEASAAGAEESKKEKVVSELVRGVGEGMGGLEGGEREVESAHLLLQSLLANTFSSSPEDFQKSYTTVIGAVEKGVKAEGGKGKGEVGLRVITNAYNLLPTNSALRPSTLLTLLTLLSQSRTTDLSSLPLTLSSLSSLLTASPLSSTEKSAFLISTSDLYASHDASFAVDVRRLAIFEGGVSKEDAEKTLALALGLEGDFGKVEEVWGMKGVKEVVGEEMGKLMGLVVGGGGEGKVGEGLEWVESKKGWFEGLSLSPALISRKLRLLALTRLCAESGSRDISYADVAKGLDIEVAEVEGWVVDAIQSSLLSARLSQPTQTLHLLSLPTSSSTTSFGSREWQLLERRLKEWRDVVEGVRVVVGEALEIGEAGPEPQGRRGGRKEVVAA